MAIITPKLRYTVAQAFLDSIQNANNAYFFIGRSRPWLDPDAHTGTGTTVVSQVTNDITITNGNFDDIPVGATIKNLDTGEIRQFSSVYSDHGEVNYHATVPWTTDNWAWKEPGYGYVWQDDNNPPQPNGTQFNQNESQNYMLALKAINQTNLNQNASFVIPRYTWETGLVYFPYSDNDVNLYSHPTQEDMDMTNIWNSAHSDVDEQYMPGSHVVIVNQGSSWYVYKCMDTGYKIGLKPGSSTIMENKPCKSTVRPWAANFSHGNNWTYTYSDGYTWRLMYTLSDDQILWYLTESWVPVRTGIVGDSGPANVQQLAIEADAISGTIENIRIISALKKVPCFGDTEAGTVLSSQGSADLNEIILPIGASSTDDYYVGCDIYVFYGDSTPSVKKTITRYDVTGNPHGNRLATVNTNWAQQPVSGTDKICIAPKISIVGAVETGGTVASARALTSNVVGSVGYLSGIQMLDVGSKYRLAEAKAVTRPYGYAGEEVPCDGVTLKAEVSPIDGHGSNAIQELGGYFAMFQLELKNIEGDLNTDNYTRDFMLSNDYRSMGIILNVLKPNGIDYADADTLRTCGAIQIESTTPGDALFFQDELIEYINTSDVVVARGYVIEHLKDPIDNTKGTITFVQDFYTGFDSFVEHTIRFTVRGVTSGVSAKVVDLLYSEIDTYSGDIIYIEQRKPINRAPEQLETMRFTVEF